MVTITLKGNGPRKVYKAIGCTGYAFLNCNILYVVLKILSRCHSCLFLVPVLISIRVCIFLIFLGISDMVMFIISTSINLIQKALGLRKSTP